MRTAERTIFLLCLVVHWLAAQSNGSRSNPDSNARPQVKASRLEGERPIIDGRLIEEIWKLGDAVNEFSQREPKEGEPATEPTEVRIFYDEGALYVGARMFSKNPEKIGGGATRRDQLGYAETFVLNLDPYHDRKTSYSFGVTVAGVRQDYYHPIDDEIKQRDVNFTPVWEARANIDSLGWTAEMRIPFSQIRYHDLPVQIWGVNFNRYIPSRNEDVYWRLRRNRDTGWSSLFGDLVGIEQIQPSRRMELLPYVSGGATFTGARDPNNPFDDGKNLKPRVGGDLKMGLGPNLTLDGTVNPDFGQVEADPAVVNLTAFETTFAERRPFFVEGNRLLSNTGQTYFYSRRIGAAPHGSVTGSFVDKPTDTEILGAAKVSGRLSSGLSLAALGGWTAREHARAFDLTTGATTSTEAEPPTGFAVVRLEQEFGQYVSTAGVVLTAVRRDFSEGSTLSAILPGQAITGGTNWNIRFEGGKYELSGDAGFSYVEGTPDAIRRLQMTSARYFQRPDATNATLDPTRTSLSGYTGSLAFNKNGGEHWLWGLSALAKSPGFELNDLGQLSTADDIQFTPSIRYRETLSTQYFHNFEFGISSASLWDFEGIRQSTNTTASGKVTLKNFWRTTLDVLFRTRGMSDNATRGGPLMGTPSSWNITLTEASGVTSRTRMSGTASYGFDEFGGWTYDISGTYAPRPGDQWDFTISPRYNHTVDSRQYVTSVSGGRSETFGRRYIFSFIDRSTISMQLRLNYNFNPDLSLEMYAEPFASSGRYYDFGELSAAQSRSLRVYGKEGTGIVRNSNGSYAVTDGAQTFTLQNSDFNVRSFRSNVVLRWEWRLGSTLYLVWQQNRSFSENQGNLVRPSALWESVRITGDNFLLLKLSYWLPVE